MRQITTALKDADSIRDFEFIKNKLSEKSGKNITTYRVILIALKELKKALENEG